MTKTKEVSIFLQSEDVKSKFDKILNGNSAAFVSNVMTVVSQNQLLQKASKESVFNAALMAATLSLSLDKNLGHAYIVPFKGEAQFQIGYKGLIQLCLRSGDFKTLGAAPIYKGQLVSSNPLTGYVFDFEVPAEGKPIGYAAQFNLLNGFEKSIYSSVQQIEEHAKKYSQSYNSKFGVWKNNFEQMAMKTVLKNLLNKYAPMSIDLQKAIVSDQGVIGDVDTMDITYPDNEAPKSIEENLGDKERENVMYYIEDCTSIEDLEMLEEKASELKLTKEWNQKKQLLSLKK